MPTDASDGGPAAAFAHIAAALRLERAAAGAATPTSRGDAEARLGALLRSWADSPAAALGLGERSPPESGALQRAYLGAARLAHPDKGGAHRVFLAVKAARDALAESSSDGAIRFDDPFDDPAYDDAAHPLRQQSQDPTTYDWGADCGDESDGDGDGADGADAAAAAAAAAVTVPAPLDGAVHEGYGYESRFWSELLCGAGARERSSLWETFDADAAKRSEVRASQSWASWPS